MTSAPRLALIAVVSLAAACKDDESPSGETAPDAGPFGRRKLGCEDADLVISAALAADKTLVALRSCAVDSDCTVHASPRFVCEDAPQVSLSSCDLPIGVGNVDASVQFIDALQKALCPRIARPCMGGATCAPARARCVAGECKMVPGLTDAGAAP